MTNDLSNHSPAELFARILAAFVDFLVVFCLYQAVHVLSQGALLTSDLAFVVTFLAAALYYGVGNSIVTGGMTLGKRLFGARVIGTVDGEPLALSRSFLRFLVFFGVFILGQEVPILLYRAFAVWTSLYILELHMLPLLIYLFVSVSLLIAEPTRRMVHDLCIGSYVVSTRTSTPKPFTPFQLRKRLFPVALSSVLGLGVWGLGTLRPPQVEYAESFRYVLEHDFSLRNISIGMLPNGLRLSAIDLEGDASAEKASSMTELLVSRGLSTPTFLQVELITVANGTPHFPETEYRVDTASFAVTEVPALHSLSAQGAPEQ